MFGHEKFKAYQYAIEFVASSAQILEELPKGFSKLIDQFRRAAIAVPLNIAEGSGKRTISERNHCYAIARGEAMECAAIVDVLACLNLIDSQRTEKAITLLKNVVAILTTVCNRDHRLQTADHDKDKVHDQGRVKG